MPVTSRWHSWIARPPPKGQVRGSNPLRGAKIQLQFYELHDSIEHPARDRAQSGRFSERCALPSCST